MEKEMLVYKDVKHPKCVLLVNYNFDEDEPVYLFNGYKEAKAEMIKQVKEEIRIAEEENEKKQGEDFKVKFEEDKVTLTEYYSDRDDVTTWKILEVRN